ncbi:MAG: hypothetical protein JKY54_13415 [Flavobacteriales bacterium]|nr:hypothetical protein [Flavobacteriales bacterium]
MKTCQYILVSCILLITVNGFSKELSFKPFKSSDTTHYSFMVGGHFYGGNDNNTGLPINTVLANIDLFNHSTNHFTICLGDLYKDRDANVSLYVKSFFNKLQVPFINAVGNHDIGALIGTKADPQFLSFTYGNDIHVILNTELNDGSIIGEQLEMFKKACEAEVDNIFIYSHRPIWAEESSDYDGVFKDNTVSKFGVNYTSEIAPIIHKVTETTNLYWMSGSLGGDAPASFFYEKQNNLHFIQTAVRGLKRDAMLKFDVKNSQVVFETISLTGQKLEDLEHYNLSFWRTAHPKEPFNYRLVPLYIKQMIFHRYFWYGIGYSVSLLLITSFFRRKRRKHG